jgi:hypothetical protein
MQKKNCILTDSEEKRVKRSKPENMEFGIKKGKLRKEESVKRNKIEQESVCLIHYEL